MKKIMITTLIFALSIVGISCKKEIIYTVEGVVLNKITQQPLEGVRVTLEDGLRVGGILPNEVEVSGETFTNAEGRFKVEIKSKSGPAVLWVSKVGYEYKDEKSTSDVRYIGVREGYQNITVNMDGIAYFNSPFYKTSVPQKDQDSLKITLLSYEDLDDDLRSLGASVYKGKGVFNFFISGREVIAKGDRYLRYKLEFTTDGVWQTKIDSVFLPTSLEVYRDTIYY